ARRRLSAHEKPRRPPGHAGVSRHGTVRSLGSVRTRPYEPAEPTALPTVVKVLLAFLPSVVMAVMHTTMISASITAYSTAVGPSSRFRKFPTHWLKLRMFTPFGSLAVRRGSEGCGGPMALRRRLATV